MNGRKIQIIIKCLKTNENTLAHTNSINCMTQIRFFFPFRNKSNHHIYTDQPVSKTVCMRNVCLSNFKGKIGSVCSIVFVVFHLALYAASSFLFIARFIRSQYVQRCLMKTLTTTTATTLSTAATTTVHYVYLID